jgi:enediyne biosynthesis thioesterase
MTVLVKTRNGEPRTPAFVYRHLVSFEETNIMGNVYFTHHLSWQGRCREMFLQAYAPSVLNDLENGLRLVTLSVGCEYFQQIKAFDEVVIEMRLAHLRQHRIGLEFDYRVDSNLVARGTQEMGCMRLFHHRLVPVEPPSSLLAALTPYEGAFKNAIAPSEIPPPGMRLD